MSRRAREMNENLPQTRYNRKTCQCRGPSPEDEIMARRLEQTAMNRPDERGFLRDSAQRVRDLSYLVVRLRCGKCGIE